jgi:hypothetical protein
MPKVDLPIRFILRHLSLVPAPTRLLRLKKVANRCPCDRREEPYKNNPIA